MNRGIIHKFHRPAVAAGCVDFGSALDDETLHINTIGICAHHNCACAAVHSEFGGGNPP